MFRTFAFNSDENRPSVTSLEQALKLFEAKKDILQGLEAPIISPVIDRLKYKMMLQDTKDLKRYTILVILTDGELTDLQACVDSLVGCSGEPISILFVGVGNGDFSKLEYLESGIVSASPVKKKSKTKPETAH